MTAVNVIADRVCKARRESVCPACRGPILPGQLIARCSGLLWMHASCFVSHGGHRHQIDGPCHDRRAEEETTSDSH